MKLRIICWNVRGLNNRERRRRIKSALKKWKGDVVVFQETKIETLNRDIIRELWAGNHVNWVELGAQGTSGGY